MLFVLIFGLGYGFGKTRTELTYCHLYSKALHLKLITFLRESRDVFALFADEMPDINRDVIEHALSIDPTVKTVKQRRRKLGTERNEVVQAEVRKLLAAGVIREFHYSEWLTNSILVKKPNGCWRMCVDFTDLNKACPKDRYPLPDINTLVDATSGYEMLSFMDALSGYHQIRIKKVDEEKIAFITHNDTYCYTMMPFGLKNTGATY
ncbi:hypothetical protein Dimus_039064 [Dionaea muscipula]